MSTPTEAHRKLVDEIVFLVAHDDHKGEAAQLLADSEARAVEAALKYEREELDRIDVIVMELTAERERVRVLEELLQTFVDYDQTPAPNCSCHLSPPCNDCVDNAGARELVGKARAALATPERKEVEQ